MMESHADSNVDDILASIRRIIADQPRLARLQAQAAAAAGPQGHAGENTSDAERGDAERGGDDGDILELTHVVIDAADDGASSAGPLGRQDAAAAAAGLTVEALVRDALQPVLKQWLDQHLPAIVEQAVAREVERLAARRMDVPSA